jgi:hypothetical protein
MSASDHLHIQHWDQFFADDLHARLYPTWWDATTANHWRHRRFMEPVIDVIQAADASWVTVGDGSGHDTWMMLRHGHRDILTTDIGIGTLRRSHAEGHIQKYAQANAEHLHFADQQFDFVLCKEAFHHMSRPYLGLYEMLRVARKALVLIEPQDPWIDFPTRAGSPQPSYERVGNFVYDLSVRELQKVCLGLNLPALLWKNHFDVYVQGCEFARADPDDPVFRAMTEAVRQGEARCRRREDKWNYLLAVLIKEPKLLSGDDQGVERQAHDRGWTIERTDRNPLLKSSYPGA